MRLDTAIVGDLVDRVVAIPDGEVSVAEFFVADWKVRLRSTRPEVTEAYADRLRSRRPQAVRDGGTLTLNVFETNALGWPPLASCIDGASSPGHFERILKNSGLRGVYLRASESNARADFCTIFDPSRLVAVHLMANVDDLPPWDAGAPCRIALNLAAVSRGWCLVHAATLSLEDEGVLIVGSAGAGKSATTLAGLAAGLKTAGDDYVLISPTDPPNAYRLYNVLKLDRDRLLRFRGLPPDAVKGSLNWHDKIELDPNELFPGSVLEQIRIRAIVVPTIADARRTHFQPVAAQYALRHLAPSLWAQLPGARASGFRFATWLTRSLPGYSVHLSDDPAEIGDATHRFIGNLIS